MNRSDSQFRTSTVIQVPPLAEHGSLVTRRLVVIVVEADEEAALASRILMLAGTDHPRVLLVGICPDAPRQTELRRRLVTIAAFLRERRLPAENSPSQSLRGLDVDIRIEQGKDWIQRIKMILEPDDALACYDGQNAGPGQNRLCDVLSSNLELPVYVFAGLHPAGASRQSILSEGASWLGSIAALGAFFLLQARIFVATQGGLQAVLLILTLFAEVSVIWLWNSLLA